MGTEKDSKKTALGCFLTFAIVAGAMILFVLSAQDPSDQTVASKDQAAAISAKIDFLNDIEEVSWWYVDKNTIYIAFNYLYSEYQVTCNAAAFHGNKAIDFGCHVFAVRYSDYPTRASLPKQFNYVYNATYRNGLIEK